jgi:D-proline reductase (dithiol) PrdB
MNSFIKQKIISKAAEYMLVDVDTPPENAIITKTLSECRVALITTAGVHLDSQKPFDVAKGDHSYRMIPNDTPKHKLMITHTHYDRSDADKDINCVFPIERLNELAEKHIIRSTASHHFGFMGYIPKPDYLINNIAPEVAKILVEDQVDVALFSPG